MRFVAPILAAAAAFFAVTFASVGAVHAADAPEASVIDLVAPVFKAMTAGSPALACALALVAACALARRYAPASWKLGTDVGGTALTFLASLGAACAAALTGGALPTLALLWTSIKIAAGASGGYTAMKRIVAPFLRYLESKLPAPFRKITGPVLKVLLYFFESKPAAVVQAEAAGAAAVESKPAPGVAGMVGRIRDIE